MANSLAQLGPDIRNLPHGASISPAIVILRLFSQQVTVLRFLMGFPENDFARLACQRERRSTSGTVTTGSAAPARPVLRARRGGHRSDGGRAWRAERRLNWKFGARPLVLRGPCDMIDDERFHWSFLRFEAQPELLLQGGKERGAAWLGCNGNFGTGCSHRAGDA